MLIKYLGLHDGRAEYDLPNSCPVIFTMKCASCRETSPYRRSDVEVVGTEDPPPPDFVEQF